MTDDSRRQVAIKMLEEWAQAAYAADWWAKNSIDIHRVSSVLAAEANDLRDEILMLMGVDDTPAAELTITAEQEGFSIDNSERKD
jgi:hypothetical protein